MMKSCSDLMRMIKSAEGMTRMVQLYGSREGEVALAERGHCLEERLFGAPAHFADQAAEAIDVLVERLDRMIVHNCHLIRPFVALDQKTIPSFRIPERRRGAVPSEVEAATMPVLALLERPPRLRSGKRERDRKPIHSGR